mgnify:CR=1 FL=1
MQYNADTLPVPEGGVKDQEMKIPRLMHQVWINRDGGDALPPSRYQRFRETFREKNPDWQMMLWNEKQVLRLFDEVEVLRKYRQMYQKLRYPVMKADVARLMVLYCYGGLYVDLDFVCLRSLDGLLQKYPTEILLVAEPEESSFSWRLANGFLISVPYHPVWLGVLDEIQRRMKNVRDQRGIDVTAKTGPVVLTEFLQGSSYGWTKWVIPTKYVLPILPDGALAIEAKGEGGSWMELQSVNSPNENGPYLVSYWWEGSGWGGERTKEFAMDFILMYLILVPVMIFLVILIFKRGQGYRL